jgi:hypothetical protein
MTSLVRKLIYIVAIAVVLTFIANIVLIALGKATPTAIVETAVTALLVFFFAGDYLRRAVSGIGFPTATPRVAPQATPGATRDDSDYEELKEKFGDLESELEDAKSKLESQADEITDLKDTIEQADSTVKESCKKIDDFLEQDSVELGNDIYPDAFIPKIYEQGPDGKPVHAYDLPAENSFSDAYTAIAASIEARKNEGRPLNNPIGRVAEAYSAKSFADNIGAGNT